MTKFILIMLCACWCVSGCRNPAVAWSLERRSPDGKMVARGRAYSNDLGFGSDGIPVTIVYINFTSGSQKDSEIMEFTTELTGSDAQAVGIEWLSPSTLEVTYRKDSQEIQFQAIKFGGIEIIARDISGIK
jgi:hypothetical protein